jgi:hypothetical protein
VIVTVCPATVSVPVRELPPEFAATLYVTVPMPDPLVPLVIVIQAALLVAVHEQLVPVPTEMVPVVGVEGADAVVGVTL